MTDEMIPGRFAERCGHALAAAGVAAKALPRATRLLCGEFAPDLANGVDVDDGGIAAEVARLRQDLPGLFESAGAAGADAHGSARRGLSADRRKQIDRAMEAGRAQARARYPIAYDKET